jgi:hypothetical protein
MAAASAEKFIADSSPSVLINRMVDNMRGKPTE